MHRLGESHFHTVGRYHLPVREFPGNALVQVVAHRIPHGVIGLCGAVITVFALQQDFRTDPIYIGMAYENDYGL